MKRLLLIIMVTLTLSFVTPVYAYEPPGQSTDNATDIILWHGDTANVTITSANVTLTMLDLQEAMTVSVEAGAQIVADSLDERMTELIAFVVMLGVMLGLAGLAYWRGDKPLFLISGLGFIVYGFSFLSTSVYFSILMVLAGMFLFIRAFTKRKMA